MADVFTRILGIELPDTLRCDDSGKNPAFSIGFRSDGPIPFPQLILHTSSGAQLLKGDALSFEIHGSDYLYRASVPAGLLWPGEITVQAEGCRKADIRQAGGEDWIKAFERLRILPDSDDPKKWPERGAFASSVQIEKVSGSSLICFR